MDPVLLFVNDQKPVLQSRQALDAVIRQAQRLLGSMAGREFSREEVKATGPAE